MVKYPVFTKYHLTPPSMSHLAYTPSAPSLYSSSTLFILLLHLIYTPFPPDSGVEICRTNTSGKNSVCYFYFLTFHAFQAGEFDFVHYL